MKITRINILIENISKGNLIKKRNMNTRKIITGFESKTDRDKNNNNVRKRREKEFDSKYFNLEDLSPNLREIMDNLIQQNAPAFSKSYNTLEQTSLITRKFNLTHSYPIQTKPYKIP